jgi:SAM-dependent methyltransferase
MLASFYDARANLKFRDNSFIGQFPDGPPSDLSLTQESHLLALEAFVHARETERARKLFNRTSRQISRFARPTGHLLEELLDGLGDHSFLLTKRFLLVKPQADCVFDLTQASRRSNRLLLDIFRFLSRSKSRRRPASFDSAVADLARWGFLVPSRGKVNWGSLGAYVPISTGFGFERGTPIDRYYLNRFIEEVRSQVRGVVIEIGGSLNNRTVYNFVNAREYHAMDLIQRPDVDIVGNAEDPAAFPASSIDSVIAFNVLEHCREPWVVIDNALLWLKPGGALFCMVPNAQRIHKMPGDYWRPLPQAVSWMLRRFSTHQLRVYGNPIALVASFMGIASEEVPRRDLDFFNPDYPVATCAVAIK